MAKLAVTNREKKRRKTVLKFKAKRAVLLQMLQSPHTSDEEARALLAAFKFPFRTERAA